jgi:hypothetical protein
VRLPTTSTVQCDKTSSERTGASTVEWREVYSEIQCFVFV